MKLIEAHQIKVPAKGRNRHLWGIGNIMLISRVLQIAGFADNSEHSVQACSKIYAGSAFLPEYNMRGSDKSAIISSGDNYSPILKIKVLRKRIKVFCMAIINYSVYHVKK